MIELVLVSLFPGILIFFFPAFKKISATEAFAYVVGISFSFWMASFWFLAYIPIGLKSFFFLVAGVTLVFLGYFYYKKRPTIHVHLLRYEIIIAILFIFFIYLRFLPMQSSIVPSGADMSMHTYITELIVHKDGVPLNYRPILNIDSFNTFPVGFHTIAALISLIGGLPPYQSVFIVACFTYFILTLFLYVFLLRFVSAEFSFISATSFTFLTTNPQNFAVWGGTPTIFALAFLILFLTLLHRLKDDSNKYLLFYSSLVLSAVLLSHTVIFVQSAYIIGFSFLLYLILSKKNMPKDWLRYVLVILGVGVITLPYLLKVDTHIATKEAMNWLDKWFENSGNNWGGASPYGYLMIPDYILEVIFRKKGGFLILGSVIGFLFLLKKKPKVAIISVSYIFICCLLISNSEHRILPFSYLLYPERTAVMVIVPLSLFFAYLLKYLFEFLEKKEINKRAVAFGGTVSFLALAVFVVSYNYRNYVDPINSKSTVTADDLKAIVWIKDHTAQDTVIKTRYFDAGLWIPAIIFRPATEMHVNYVYLDKKVGRLNDPSYFYVGKKCFKECSEEGLENTLRGLKYTEVYSNNGVRILKLK